MKKITAMLLALIMLLSLVACGSAGQTTETAETAEAAESGLPVRFNEDPQWDGSLPLVAEGEDNVITIGVQANANVLDFETNKYTLWLEEQTGLDLQFVTFGSSSSDAATQISLMIAGNEELPDILYSFSGIKTTSREYVQDGYFLDLAPYFKTDAYYTEKTLDMYYGEEGEIRETTEKYILSTITDSVSGTIVGFPTVFNNPSDDNMGHIWINQRWLDALGLTAPTNVDELYDVLVAFRDGDPNGNGIKDEIPMMGLADKDMWSITQWVTNAFIYEYDMYKFNVENDVVYAPYDQPEYREAMIYIKKLVDEGLLSTMAWTATNTEIKTLVNPTDGVYTVGIVSCPGDNCFENNHQSMFDYVPLKALEDATGRGGWAPTTVDRTSYGTYITADCDNPTVAFRLLDFIASGESYLRHRWGEYGVDWKYVDESNTLPGMLGGEAKIDVINPQVYSEVNNQTWHNNGLLASEGYWQYCIDLEDGSWRSQMYKNLQTIVKNYEEGKQPEQVIYNVKCTEENEADYLDANASIVDYYRTSRANFCNGIWDPTDDAQWESYIKGLDALGYYDVWIATAQESWDMNK